jgi:Rrf2 family protein
MALLSRKGLLAIAAVVDVAVNGRERPISARSLAERHDLPPRHLEPVLQALVREGIFHGLRGPRGGYRLSRESKRISVADVLRVAETVAEADEAEMPKSRILDDVVLPAIGEAEKTFTAVLAHLTIEDLVRRADALGERDAR